MARQGFDISRYITAADIVSAVTAGTIAYLTYKTKQEEPKPEQPQQGQQPQAAQPRGQAPAAQPQAQPQAPAVPKNEPGWMKYCDDPSDPNEVAAARLQYKAEQLSNATGGAPSATGTFQGGQLTSATANGVSPSGGMMGASVADTTSALTSSDKAFLDAFKNVTFKRPMCVKQPNGVLTAVGRMKDGTTWMAPMFSRGGNYPTITEIITQDGRVLEPSDVLNVIRKQALEQQAWNDDLTGTGFFVDAVGKLRLKR